VDAAAGLGSWAEHGKIKALATRAPVTIRTEEIPTLTFRSLE
jgi:hypothetical protein